MYDPLGDNLKEALNSFDRMLQRIKDLNAAGPGFLSYFNAGRVHWNHLRMNTDEVTTHLCGEPYDKLAGFTPASKGGQFCPDCVRAFKDSGGKGTL